MRVGISTAALFPEYPTEEAAQKIKSLCVPVIELFLSTFYEYRPEYAKSLAPLLEGTEINSVRTMPLNFECNFFSNLRRVSGDGYYWLDQIARSAQLLKCKNYTFRGLPRVDEYGEDFSFIAERIAQAYDFMAGYGVSLCIENTVHYAFNSPDFFKELLSRRQNIYGVFDMKQAIKSGYPYQMYLKAMQGRIAYVRLCDITASGKTCLPGEGVLNFEEIFKRFKDCGFNGDVIIGNGADKNNGIDGLEKSFLYLSELAYKLN